jgi:cysteine-S-conjugate beta-lyase
MNTNRLGRKLAVQMDDPIEKKWSVDTVLAHTGRPSPTSGLGVTTNHPVFRASSVLFRSQEELALAKATGRKNFFYGRFGTPTTQALADVLTELECGAAGFLTPSGLAASMVAIKSVMRSGDEIFLADGGFGGLRRALGEFADQYGIVVKIFNREDVKYIKNLINDRTRAIYVENPSCTWLEFVDIPAIVAQIADQNITLIVDNTWATPRFTNPIRHGADIVVHSLTKYIAGHDDLMMGAVVCTEQNWKAVQQTIEGSGISVGSDDAYLALRGLRTLGVRLDRHAQSALCLAHWLEAQPQVRRVFHPALPSHEDHLLFARDFTGASGLFSIELQDVEIKAVRKSIEDLDLFGSGVGWGGFASAVEEIGRSRDGISNPSVRLHIGLENVDDLRTDLSRFLKMIGQQ